MFQFRNCSLRGHPRHLPQKIKGVILPFNLREEVSALPNTAKIEQFPKFNFTVHVLTLRSPTQPHQCGPVLAKARTGEDEHAEGGSPRPTNAAHSASGVPHLGFGHSFGRVRSYVAIGCVFVAQWEPALSAPVQAPGIFWLETPRLPRSPS